jgi:murein DD-endopeptidase MepM/ murein hydrolase activator NlpD
VRDDVRRAVEWAGSVVGLLVGGLVVWPSAPAAADARSSAWRWPLDGAPAVSRPFAPGPTRYSAGHYGADLRGSSGQPVRAAGAGRVSYAGLVAGRGVVVVQHGRLRTTYEPVTAAVRVGQAVSRGDVLGRLQTGHLCAGGGACLHWGLRRGDAYLDPVRLVGAGPVRLLPVPRTGAAPAAPVLHSRPPRVTTEPATARRDPVDEPRAEGPTASSAAPTPAHGGKTRSTSPLAAAATLAMLAGLVAARSVAAGLQ